MICRRCDRTVQWLENEDGLGWWVHGATPPDGHDPEVTETVKMQELHEFAFGLAYEMGDKTGREYTAADFIGVARTLMTDLLERGWRPPVE